MGRKENITIRLTVEQRDMLFQLADACGVTVSRMVELLIQQYLEEHDLI